MKSMEQKEEGSEKSGGCRKDILREEVGMVTVYVSLVFLMIMGVAFCVIEGVREYELSSLEEDAFISAGKGVLANYDKELYSRYNIFFLDPREKDYMAEDGRDALHKRLISKGFYAASCSGLEAREKICATDYHGKVLHHQIRELMKYEVLDTAADKLGEYIHLMQKIDYDGNRSKINNLQDKEEAAEQEKREQEESAEEEKRDGKNGEGQGDSGESGKEKIKDPSATPEGRRYKSIKRTITGIIRAGILNYVTDDPGNISVAHIPEGGLPSNMYGRAGETSIDLPGMSFSGLGYLLSYFSHNESDSYKGDIPMDDMMDIAYADRYFNRFGKTVNKETVLKYEIEYLCIGRKSDLDNLKGVVRRIMLMRFASNFAFASTDAEITGEAEVMADILAGALDMPVLASTMKMMLIGALSYGETLLDVHTLLAGGKIPLIKSADTWNISFTEASGKLAEKSMAKQGKYNVDYENFLKIILLCQGKRSRMLFRMMDLMQINVRQKEEGFFMKDCLFSFELKGRLYSTKWFPVIPGFGLVSGNRLETEICRTFSY